MSIKLMATIGKNFELSSDVKKLWYLPENENIMFYHQYMVLMMYNLI